MLIGGGFNAVLLGSDRENGAIVTSTKTEDFRYCLEESELREVRAVSPQFT